MVLVLIAALNVLGAEVSGVWKATAEGPQGLMERTFTFKADGSKLTGETASSMMGKSTIDNGKVDGDNNSFVVNLEFIGNKITQSFKGTISDCEINFSREDGGGDS